MRRPIVILIIVILLASLSCKTLMPDASTAIQPSPTTQAAVKSPIAEEEVATQAIPTTEPVMPSPTTTEKASETQEGQASPDPTAVLEPAVARSMNQIQRDVIEIRGLQPSTDVPRALLTPDELRQRVIDDFLAEYTPEDAELDVVELSALGLVEPGFDFLSFFTELLSEQVAGYYDNELKEMYVVAGEGFGGPERLHFSHEYVHALQDQTYDIENELQFNDEICDEDTERCAAILALMEGDASTVELEWFMNYATQADQQEVIDFYNTYTSPEYDSAPDFMKEDFVFPYTYGQTFVDNLLQEGGWEAVDAAYADVPVSTEQILHPELYPDDKPLPVEMPDLLPVLGEGWSELDRNVMGEWYTYLILAKGVNTAAQVDGETAFEAAAGWGGDAYTIYYNEETGETVVVIDWRWDRERDASQFAEAFVGYADARFGVNGDEQGDWWTWENDEVTNLFYANDDRTTWIYAPDTETAQAISAALAIE